MTTLNLVISAFLALFVLLMFGALVEIHRQLLQVRESVGLVDRVRPVEFNSEVRLSDLPLPGLGHISPNDRHVVLILSDSCTTCADVARGLGPKETSGLITLVEARSVGSASSWMAQTGVEYSPSAVHDQDGRIADALGVSVTPAAVKFEGIAPVAATTVPSTRQLGRLRTWLQHLEESMSGLEEG